MHHQAQPARLLALLALAARRRATTASSISSFTRLASPFSSSSSAARAPPEHHHESEASSAAATPAPPPPTPEAEARSALRSALRAVDAHFTAVAGNAQWRAYVLEQARKLRQNGDINAINTATETARDYAELVETVARHVALLKEYNIGVDPDARNRAMVAKTAARVGLSIPKSVGEREDEEAAAARAAEEGGEAGGARPSIARRAAMARASAALGERAGAGARRK